MCQYDKTIQKMIEFDYVTKDIITNNPDWPQILDHLYKILLICNCGLGKTNTLLNLISHQPDINKIYLYAKDPHGASEMWKCRFEAL